MVASTMAPVVMRMPFVQLQVDPLQHGPAKLMFL